MPVILIACVLIWMRCPHADECEVVHSYLIRYLFHALQKVFELVEFSLWIESEVIKWCIWIRWYKYTLRILHQLESVQCSPSHRAYEFLASALLRHKWSSAKCIKSSWIHRLASSAFPTSNYLIQLRQNIYGLRASVIILTYGWLLSIAAISFREIFTDSPFNTFRDILKQKRVVSLAFALSCNQNITNLII